MDVALLSRIQFAVTIGFHFIFPPMSIGLAILMVIMEGAYLRTRRSIYYNMARFWTSVFGLIFAIGVASGIVMEFQFGTNWATYSRFVGDVFGSALAAEGVFAFFLESGFLALVLFGWNRVRPGWHFFATCMVAFGSVFSAVWIIVANSWQQTPAGYHIVGTGDTARAEIVDFWAVVFSPSSMDRLSHVLSASILTGSFFVISVSAYYILRKRHVEFATRSMRIALTVALVGSLLQLLTGHSSAVGVSQNQPAKLAAFEAHYETGPGTMYLFGWANDANQRVDVGVGIPGLLSFLVSGNPSTPIKGLLEFAPSDRPPVGLVFQTYHLMVAIGMGLIALSIVSLLMLWQGSIFRARWLLWILIFSVMGPQLANQLGWASAEVGRQPWIVYGLLRTRDAISRVVTADQVLASLIMFGLIYVLLFALFLYLLDNKIRHGPEEIEPAVEGQRA